MSHMQIDIVSIPPRAVTVGVQDELLRALPKLRKYAISLCRDTERADDLTQETALKALANINLFEPGSSMTAWLFTILRNQFYSEFRKRRHEVEDEEGRYAGMMQIHAEQEGHLHFLEVRDAMDQLVPNHREALILVGASELSYADAAALCKCAVGTMKSRVNRARAALGDLLGVKSEEPLIPSAA